MTKHVLTYDQLKEGARLGLESGRFRWQERGARIVCTFCGRKGWSSGWWLERCLLGHPYVCGQCGQVFASKQGIAMHRRHRRDHVM